MTDSLVQQESKVLETSDLVLPNFVIIGAPKCGTTSIHSYLSTHPQIFMTREKELNFFLPDASWGTWNRGLRWYSKQFQKGRGGAIRGESSPYYSAAPYAKNAATLIAKHIPDCKILYMVRDPIDRIKSNYGEELFEGRMPANLTLDTIVSASPHGDDLASYYHRYFVGTSLYGQVARHYLAHFGKARVLFASLEEMTSDTPGFLTRVLNFLGVKEDYVPPNLEVAYNARKGERLPYRRLKKIVNSLPGYKYVSLRVPDRIRRVYRYLISRDFDSAPLVALSEGNLKRLERMYKRDLITFQNVTGYGLPESYKKHYGIT